MKIETIAVHGGYTPDPTTKAVAVPTYQTVAYAFADTQHGAGYPGASGGADEEPGESEHCLGESSARTL